MLTAVTFPLGAIENDTSGGEELLSSGCSGAAHIRGCMNFAVDLVVAGSNIVGFDLSLLLVFL